MISRAGLSRIARFSIVASAGASAGIAAASGAAFVFAPLDLLNQIAPLWLLLALLGGLATRFVTERPLRLGVAIAFTASTLVHTALIAPELLRSAPSPTSTQGDTPRIRIVWLNTQSGSAPAGVTEYLLNSDADFLLLSEYHAERDALPEDLASAYPHFAACPEPHDCNVVILSRHAPQAERNSFAPNESGLRMVWADFDIEGAPLRLVGTHLNRPYPAGRYAAQRTELLAFLEASERDDLILAGDFNAAPWSAALRTLDAESGLTRHDRAMPTWPAAAWTRLRLPAPEAFMPIDHVYSGAHWQLVSIRRGPRTGADHFPIEAEFVWRGAH